MSKKKTKKPVAIAELANDKLVAEISTRKKELMALRFKHKLGELTDNSLFKKARKVIAQVSTELNKRKRGN